MLSEISDCPLNGLEKFFQKTINFVHYQKSSVLKNYRRQKKFLQYELRVSKSVKVNTKFRKNFISIAEVELNKNRNHTKQKNSFKSPINEE